jgi:hypothetical protein
LLHHHEHDKQLTEAEQNQIASTGATTRGTVMRSEPSAAAHQRTQVRVVVRFKGGPDVELSEELPSLYQPAPGSPAAQRLAQVRAADQVRHPDRMPKMQVPVSLGERIPVRYDAANPARAVIDRPALEKQALEYFIEQRAAERAGRGPRGSCRRPAVGGAGPLPELRRPGRPGHGLAGRGPALRVLRSAGTGQPARELRVFLSISSPSVVPVLTWAITTRRARARSRKAIDDRIGGSRQSAGGGRVWVSGPRR